MTVRYRSGDIEPLEQVGGDGGDGGVVVFGWFLIIFFFPSFSSLPDCP